LTIKIEWIVGLNNKIAKVFVITLMCIAKHSKNSKTTIL